MTKSPKTMTQISNNILSEISKAKHLSDKVFPLIGKFGRVTSDIEYYAAKESMSMQSVRRKYYLWINNGKQYSAIIDRRVIRNFRASDDKAFSILLGYWSKSRSVSQAYKDFASYCEREYGYIPGGFSIVNARRLLRNILKVNNTTPCDVSPERCKTCKARQKEIKNLIRELMAVQKGCKNCDAILS